MSGKTGKAYLEEYSIKTLLQRVLNCCIEEQPEEPLKFIAEELKTQHYDNGKNYQYVGKPLIVRLELKLLPFVSKEELQKFRNICQWKDGDDFEDTWRDIPDKFDFMKVFATSLGLIHMDDWRSGDSLWDLDWNTESAPGRISIYRCWLAVLKAFDLKEDEEDVEGKIQSKFLSLPVKEMQQITHALSDKRLVPFFDLIIDNKIKFQAAQEEYEALYPKLVAEEKVVESIMEKFRNKTYKEKKPYREFNECSAESILKLLRRLSTIGPKFQIFDYKKDLDLSAEYLIVQGSIRYKYSKREIWDDDDGYETSWYTKELKKGEMFDPRNEKFDFIELKEETWVRKLG